MLQDIFGRTFPYLRLSVTDACNFRCKYCLPKGYIAAGKNFLHLEEIIRLIRAFSELGVWKVRLTGGEPTIRHDLIDIIKGIRSLPKIRRLALTTNGYNLKQKAALYLAAGIDDLNISIDSLNAQNFALITGHDKLPEILEGIELAKKLGCKKIKVNAVLLKGHNDREIEHFIEWIRFQPYSMRFIELMETGETRDFFQKHHISGEIVEIFLSKTGWIELPRSPGAGPAQEYRHDDFQGTVGLIRPYGKNFCSNCNRLRVSAEGGLQLCLFGDGRYNLRPFLQHDDQLPDLQQAIIDALRFKEQSHHLQQGNTGITNHLASIGG